MCFLRLKAVFLNGPRREGCLTNTHNEKGLIPFRFIFAYERIRFRQKLRAGCDGPHLGQRLGAPQQRHRHPRAGTRTQPAGQHLRRRTLHLPGRQFESHRSGCRDLPRRRLFAAGHRPRRVSGRTVARRERHHRRGAEIPYAQPPPRGTAGGRRAGPAHPARRRAGRRRLHLPEGRHRRILGRRPSRGDGLDDRQRPSGFLDSLLSGHLGRAGQAPSGIVHQPAECGAHPRTGCGLLAGKPRDRSHAPDPAAALGRRQDGASGQQHLLLHGPESARHRILDAPSTPRAATAGASANRSVTRRPGRMPYWTGSANIKTHSR